MPGENSEVYDREPVVPEEASRRSPGRRARRPYLRIEEKIRERVRRRELVLGEILPEEDVLAAELGAHRFVVRRALEDLVREEVLYYFPSQGHLVSAKLQLEAVKGRFIALLHSYSSKDFFRQGFNRSVMNGVKEGVGREVLVFSSAGGGGGVGPDLDTIPWDRADGVMLFSIFREGFLEEVAERGAPTVAVDYDAPESPVDCVAMDNFEAGYQPVKHLIELGHRRIAHIGEPRDMEIPDPAWQDRRRGYEAALEEAGIELDDRYFVGLPTRWATENNPRLNALLDLEDRPTAIHTTGDGLAFLMMRLAANRGLEVPRDLSVVGFGGSGIAEFGAHPLTTVSSDSRELGRVAGKRLAVKIEKGDTEIKRILTPVTFLIRESTAPPPAG